MQVIDLRKAGHVEVSTDLAIVGSGPAAVTLAAELQHTRLSIVIIESGGLVEERTCLSEIENIGAWRSIDQRGVRNRILGGTSHTWTGRCAPLDAIDYEARAWIPLSGWPVTYEEMQPYVKRASAHLGIDPDFLDHRPRPQPDPQLDPRLLKDIWWQYSQDERDRNEPTRFGPRLLESSMRNVTLIIHATATHLMTNASGSHVEGVELKNLEGKEGTVRARSVVLAAGAIENARILLYSNRTIPHGVGNEHDVVGRFFMDHPRCVLGDLDPRQLRAIWARFGYYIEAGRRGAFRFIDGVGLAETLQREDGLLNCSAWLDDERATDDPLDAAKRLLGRKSENSFRDARAVLSRPRWIAQALQDRFVHRRITLHKMSRASFLCIVEQVPDRDSRLRLGSRRDMLGLPRPVIDWRIGDLERTTAARLGQILCAELKRIGLQSPILADWIQHDDHDSAEFIDVAHPIGSTRMASDPKQGVVDENCEVHGVEGLFVAGSSVFPTAGHANPTLMIAAFAVRMADLLKARAHGGSGLRQAELQVV